RKHFVRGRGRPYCHWFVTHLGLYPYFILGRDIRAVLQTVRPDHSGGHRHFGLCLPDPEPGHGRPVDAPWGKETQRTDLCAPQTLCPHWGPLQPLYGTALAKLWEWGP